MDPDLKLKKIGERLRELRKKKGYNSYETFSYDFNLNKQTVQRAETGENIRMRTLITLLEIFEVSLEDFFKGIK